MSQAKVRVSKELYDKLQELAKSSNKPIRELVDTALKLYIYGFEGNEDKPIEKASGRIIQVQYPSKCKSCGRDIEKGELAYWVRYEYEDGTSKSFLICLDCYYKDTALANMYLKKKQLERIIKGLKKMADNLADKVEKLRVEADLYSARSELIRILDSIKMYVRDNPTDIQRIYELKEAIVEVGKRLEELEEEIKLLSKSHKIVRVERGVY